MSIFSFLLPQPQLERLRFQPSLSVCFSVCLSVCLHVSTITEKVTGWFSWIFDNRQIMNKRMVVKVMARAVLRVMVK